MLRLVLESRKHLHEYPNIAELLFNVILYVRVFNTGVLKHRSLAMEDYPLMFVLNIM